MFTFSKAWKRAIAGIAGGLLTLALALTVLVWPMAGAERLKLVTIPQGVSGYRIAVILKEQGIIRFAPTFYIYNHVIGAARRLQAGEYVISPSYTYARLSRILRGEEGQALTRVTIPEGVTIEEIAQILNQKKIVPKAQFLGYIQIQAKLELTKEFPFLESVPTTNLEGYLFPETYFFAKGLSAKEVARAFLKEFNRQALPLYEAKKSPWPLHKVITLASIVEKEGVQSQELPIISGVFHNRLARDMELQSCPTVAYALGKPQKIFLTLTDVRTKSPYNTYLLKGLPPTPIASPGKKAIEAALYPRRSSYLYFVATGDGTHHFSARYTEHLQHQRILMRKMKAASSK